MLPGQRPFNILYVIVALPYLIKFETESKLRFSNLPDICHLDLILSSYLEGTAGLHLSLVADRLSHNSLPYLK